MVLLISGSTHTGKTKLANDLMVKYQIPYLSIDHIKMGLIRTKMIDVTVYEDEKIEELIWPVIREIIKTNIENNQNLIIEGCYIPYNYKEYFDEKYLDKIRSISIIMSENYINSNFNKILEFENVIEKRLTEDIKKEELIIDNNKNLSLCKKYNLDYILIDKEYKINFEI